MAINRGEADGVESGMEFTILSSDVQEVSDPDTNEYLGSFDTTEFIRYTGVPGTPTWAVVDVDTYLQRHCCYVVCLRTIS